MSRKRYKIDTYFLLKSNRKSYALHRMVTLPMTLSAPNHPKPPHFLHFALPFIQRRRKQFESGGAHGERGARAYKGVWERSPQRGPGAEPLVRGSEG